MPAVGTAAKGSQACWASIAVRRMGEEERRVDGQTRKLVPRPGAGGGAAENFP